MNLAQVNYPESLRRHMRESDIKAFREAATGMGSSYSFYILLRQTNPLSIKYIGEKVQVFKEKDSPIILRGTSPKRIDCKMKTASFDFFHIRLHRVLKVGGLVVNPVMDSEFMHAFVSNHAKGPDLVRQQAKYKEACDIWEKNKHLVYEGDLFNPDGSPKLAYIPNGKLYALDHNKQSLRYGCLMFSSSGLSTASTFIHGDYDIFAIVPAGREEQNIRITEQMLGQPHSRDPHLRDVQYRINALIRKYDPNPDSTIQAMVLHGSQETYDPPEKDEVIYVFYPDGKVGELHTLDELNGFYMTELKGRKIFRKNHKYPKTDHKTRWEIA